MTTDRDSFAIAGGRLAKAFVFAPGARGIAFSGACVEARSVGSTIHAYDHSSAIGLAVGVTIVKHDPQAMVSGFDGSHIQDVSSRSYDGAELEPVDQIIYNLTESQFSDINEKSPGQRSTLKQLIRSRICTPTVALSLPGGVLDALELSLKKYVSEDFLGDDELTVLLQNEKFIEELGSLKCQQQLRAETISLHDLIQQYRPDSLWLSSSGSAMSTSSSSSSSAAFGVIS